MHLLFFPARTTEMENVHRLKQKEIQWKRGTQPEDACVKGQEIFYGNIRTHRKTYAAERQFCKSYGKQQFWTCYHNYLKKRKECSMVWSNRKGWLLLVWVMLAKIVGSQAARMQKSPAVPTAGMDKQWAADCSWHLISGDWEFHWESSRIRLDKYMEELASFWG